MKILYDYQAFTLQQFGGISKSFSELICHLPNNIDYNISVAASNNFHIKKINNYSKIPPAIINYNSFLPNFHFRGKKHIYFLFNKIFKFFPSEENLNIQKTINLLKKGDFDVFHPTFFDDYYLPYLDKKPFVLTIHDMMPELFPQYYKHNDKQIVAKRKLINKASAIIAVSEQTKKDIINILDIPKDKITVIYHGGPKIENITDEPIVKSPYFLYVGTRNAYKNFTQTIIDFKTIHNIKADISLICTGDSFTTKEKELIKHLKLEQFVIQKKVNDKELKNLYRYAIAFIYPSSYEGFGMPILEAYAYGCPVLLNNKSCFPEIAQNAALYFTSDNNGSNLPQTMLEAINWSTDDRNLQIEKGYKRLSNFSWINSARKLADLYASIK